MSRIYDESKINIGGRNIKDINKGTVNDNNISFIIKPEVIGDESVTKVIAMYGNNKPILEDSVTVLKSEYIVTCTNKSDFDTKIGKLITDNNGDLSKFAINLESVSEEITFPDTLRVTPKYIISNSMTSAKNLFKNCSVLSYISPVLFKFTPNIENVDGLFTLSIDERTLPEKIALNIPDDLFIYLPKLKSANLLLAGRRVSIYSIPENLFKHNANLETAYQLATVCSNLRAIPSNLFKFNSKLKDLSQAFKSSGIEQVPYKLLSSNVLLEDIDQMFVGCNNLVRVENFLEPNRGLVYDKLHDISGLLENCPKLEEVSVDLFDYISSKAPLVLTNASKVFKGDSKLKMIPPLWNRFANVTNKSEYATGCENAVNYNDVPDGWK